MKSLVMKGIDLHDTSNKICVSLMKPTLQEIKQELSLLRHCDVQLVEWRIDQYQEDVYTCARYIKEHYDHLIIIYTLRSKREGGAFEGSVQEQFELLKQFIQFELADMIDLEYSIPKQMLDKLIACAKYHHTYCILSSHDFLKTESYEQLIATYTLMSRYDVDIVKIACMPNDFEDVLRLMNASLWASKHVSQPIVSISMGSLGMITRVFAKCIGSCFSFASLQEASAPGQIDVDELSQMFHIIELNS